MNVPFNQRRPITTYPYKSKRTSNTVLNAARKRSATAVQAARTRPLPFYSNPSTRSAAFVPTSPEVKCVDIPFINAQWRLASTPAAAIFINGVAQGSGFYNRNGARFEMQSLRFRMRTLTVNTAGGRSGDTLRCLIIYDRQVNGVAPLLADVIQGTDYAGATATRALDFRVIPIVTVSISYVIIYGMFLLLGLKFLVLSLWEVLTPVMSRSI